MAIARSEVVTEGTEGVFYCVSRRVRRAFLCGEDPYSGRSYEHRREWIRSRPEALATCFAIEVFGFAVTNITRPPRFEDPLGLGRGMDLLKSGED